MKKMVLVIAASVLCTSLFANDIEKNSASFEKWGNEYKVGSEVLKKLSEIFTGGEEKYFEKFPGETIVGIMGIPEWEIRSDKEFMKGKTVEDLSQPDLNIRVAAHNLGKCIESYGATDTAIKCYSEYLADEGAGIMGNMILEYTLEEKNPSDANTTETVEKNTSDANTSDTNTSKKNK